MIKFLLKNLEMSNIMLTFAQICTKVHWEQSAAQFSAKDSYLGWSTGFGADGGSNPKYGWG